MSMWWTMAEGNMMGAIIGSAIGVVGGTLGGVGGWLAPRGIARRPIMGAMAVMLGMGVGFLGLGAIALLVGQPRHVWYFPLLVGVIVCFTCPFAVRALHQRYTEVERRRLEADMLRAGASKGSRKGGAGLSLGVMCGLGAAGAAALLLTALLLISSRSNAAAASAPEVEALPHSDMRLSLTPLPDLDTVGVVAIYDVGFLDDPEGMPQMAHLAEHLRVTSAGGGMSLFGGAGHANAETMPLSTHYDFSGPPEKLAEILRVEQSRLESLRFTAEDIAREAPRCAGEVDFVAMRGGAALLKFAFMAAHQGWRYGAERVNVRGDVERITPEAAATFIEAHYRPDALTLYISGDAAEDSMRELVDQTLGAVRRPAADRPARVPLDWSSQPELRRMEWDVPAEVVLLTCASPPDPAERLALTYFGTVLSERMARSGGGGSIASMPTWPVGELPFFMMTTTQRRESIEEATARLHTALNDALEAGVTNAETEQLRAMVQFLTTRPTMQTIAQQVMQLERMGGMSPEQAAAAAMNQSALNQHFARMMIGGETQAMQTAMQLDAAAITRIARAFLAPEHRRLTLLIFDETLDE